MENDLIQRKDPFPKTVADACRILAIWKNKSGNIDNRKQAIDPINVMRRKLSRHLTRKDKVF